MATIENSYTGDGSTVLFSFTFEYIEQVDVEVSVDSVTIATTEYSLANSTTIEFNTAPASGAAIRIYRNTTVNNPKATFFPGSAIRAQDLNDNFEQILFVTQEADAISERAEEAADQAQIATTAALAASATATSAATSAQTAAATAQAQVTAAQTAASDAAADAATAISTANSAVATANSAENAADQAEIDAAAAAVSAAQAQSDASSAQQASSTAQSLASSASSAAGTAAADAATAASDASSASTAAANASASAQTAVNNANTAVSDAAAAVSTANTAASDASAAVTTANLASVKADTAISDSASAVTTANSADTKADSAVATANSADTKADSAVATANTADTNASAAVTTANAADGKADTAISDSATAVSTANSAVTTAGNADTKADSAIATANTASTDAATATSTANTAESNSLAAIATANSASTTAAGAVTTANSADAKADTAIATANSATTTANAADTKADAAVQAVSDAYLFDVVANVAAIPSSPSDGDAVRVADSTGIQSFTPITSVPSGFVGDSGLNVEIIYSSSGSTWTFLEYTANDPDDRYGYPPFVDVTRQNTVDAATLSGVALNSTDLGTFTGNTISDASTIKSALQSLETEVETKADLVGGVVPTSQLPALAVTEFLGTVVNQTAMLALTGQRGDFAIRTDTGSTFVLTSDGGSTLSDWQELETPTDSIQTVNGQSGTVVLGPSDVGAVSAASGGTFSGNVEIGTGIDLNTTGSASFAGGVETTGGDNTNNSLIQLGLGTGSKAGIKLYSDKTASGTSGIKVQINASDGSASFAGNVLSTGTTNTDIRFQSKTFGTETFSVIGDGTLKIQQDKVALYQDGSATFAGDVESTNTSYGFKASAISYGFTSESSLGNAGKAFYANHTGSPSTSRYFFYGENTSGQAVTLATDGSANFAGDVTTNQNLLVKGSDANGLYIRNGANTAWNVQLKGDGSATFAGNISVSGTVDGRNVAADGSKLDGIESGATADQTASEIRTLVQSATDSNVLTDALKTKLDGIAAGADVNVATNLGKTTSTTSNTITSSTGSNVTINEATGSAAGLMSTTHHNKLDGIASGATNVTNNNQLTNGRGFITSSQIPASFVTGMILMFTGTSAPSGWALCNGSNGTPDLRDRFIVGYGSSYSIGNTGGSTDAIVVSHSHSISDPGHGHSVSDPGHGHSVSDPGHSHTMLPSGPGPGMPVSGIKPSYGGPKNPISTTSVTTGISISGNSTGVSVSGNNTAISINSNGSSGSGKNLPPYYALAFIMKT